jgi:hypothetical protein
VDGLRFTARRVVLILSLAGPIGCGGNLPPAGSQAVVPPDYKEREKKIADGFKEMMKQKAESKSKKTR